MEKQGKIKELIRMKLYCPNCGWEKKINYPSFLLAEEECLYCYNCKKEYIKHKWILRIISFLYLFCGLFFLSLLSYSSILKEYKFRGVIFFLIAILLGAIEECIVALYIYIKFGKKSRK